MPLNLPPRSRQTSALNRVSSLYQNDDLDKEIIETCKTKGVPIQGNVNASVTKARIAGLNREDVLALARVGLFAWNASDWAKIREIYTLSAQDPNRTVKILGAGLSAVEVRELINKDEFSDDAIELLARLRARN